jgi:hypothetical protein
MSTIPLAGIEALLYAEARALDDRSGLGDVANLLRARRQLLDAGLGR